MLREQAIVREIASMISIVACCHGAKLCAYPLGTSDRNTSQHCCDKTMDGKKKKILTDFRQSRETLW